MVANTEISKLPAGQAINTLTGTGTIDNMVIGGSSPKAGTFGAVIATSFTGAGTGLTGTAASLTAGNATTATTLTTPRAIYGNDFDGSAALTEIIASTYGGTGNGFSKFSGATTTEKTYTLPDASTTILTTNTAVTAVQGGTSQTTYAAGDILYASATNTLSKLAKGSDTQVLTLASGLPSWAAAAGGAMVLLNTQNASSSASIIFSNTYITAAYTNYRIIVSGIFSDTSNVNLQMLFSSAGVYYTTAYVWKYLLGGTPNGNNNDAQIILTSSQIGTSTDDAGQSVGFVIDISGLSTHFVGSYNGMLINGAVALNNIVGGFGRDTTNGTIDAIKFQMSSGNIAAGKFSLYGVTS